MSQPGFQNCTLFCNRLPDAPDTNSTNPDPVPWYLLSIFQEGFVGQVTALQLSTSDLTNDLGRFGVDPQHSALILGLQVGQTYLLSDQEIPDSFAKISFGIPLHDGDMPDEANQIQFTKVAGNANVIDTVSIFLNSRVRGDANWAGLKACLASNPLFTGVELAKAEISLLQTGVANVTPHNGAETSIVECILKNRPAVSIR
ncbi:MAG TPA: hypothetical protein VHT24_00455 [Pseudacidobacterium sp.]|jgi:hypothetical protein|nr:hypothetical protein [Pseudacidobacterium sp.]